MRAQTPCAVALLLALFAVTACDAPQPAPVPTILLITVDGVPAPEAAAAEGAAGHLRVDRLSRDGVVFADARSVTPLTRPAVATYLTGATPPTHGVRDDLSTALADGVVTLAEVLSGAGWATAAFPDSSALGFDSGLLGGFEVVDDPPPNPVGPLTWLPSPGWRKASSRSLELWLQRVDASRPALAWVHLSHGLAQQLLPAEDASRPPAGALTAAVDGLLDALVGSSRYEQAWIVLVGTAGDIRGGDEEVAGPGLSLERRALQVPLLVKPPAGVTLPADAAAWGPDVATTLAAAAGVALPGAAGIDLRDGAPADRIRLAWSGATRDQLGWRPLVAAQLGTSSLIAGLEADPVRRRESTAGAADDDPDWDRLAEALAAAGMPAAPSVPLDAVRASLEAYDVELDAVPAGGRPFDDRAARAQVGREFLAGRMAMLRRDVEAGLEAYERALKIDPSNLGAGLARGQFPALVGQGAEARRFLAHVAGRYPDHPDVLHWFAHAIWGTSVPDASRLLTAVLPFKPRESDVLYDLACARSIAGELSESEAFLRRAVEAGYREWRSMDADPDLRNLRESGRFAAVLREYRQ